MSCPPNPGSELTAAPPAVCKKDKCRNYEQTCMYNTQGEYVCSKTEKQQTGWIFITSNGASHVLYKSEIK